MRTILNQEVVPTARRLPGFASGSWFQALEGGCGTAVLIFDSQQAARAAAMRFGATVHGMVNFDSEGLERVCPYSPSASERPREDGHQQEPLRLASTPRTVPGSGNLPQDRSRPTEPGSIYSRSGGRSYE
jgi:hypothetical protein